MSVESHELAITIINDGEGEFGSSYQERLAVAAKHRLFRTRNWVDLVEKAAVLYTNKFCEESARWYLIFSDSDVLNCAAELAEYYTELLTELAKDSADCIECHGPYENCYCGH